ncbi:biotin synthase [Paenibacillus sp. FSL R7-0273]|uniref:[FeFe] hydrogenase H-cluster radical SAM maturase HydE n=1 Tax=Paenibacillus sp. FSL R7-0273 TaxID=1536772 RepID=UPI0004F81CD1|nr:[FeFe] hydrogenase H-cluster radical SAM maturase HydE [Paenibacillus sp. FSL R7-0273]AIQ47181.1 biotin synthase [Paenibacillus sp. FSL R7-0273]OMF91505.1 [FeFe] hydrogenase H-cluster radical SAM maturase HydE [Paenibacillus sp. FSL R7-0273]
MEVLLNKLSEQHELTEEEIVWFLGNLTPEWKQQLYCRASEVRKQQYGVSVYSRGLIEFSSFCRQDCLYCGLRRSNSSAERYRLTEEEIIECAAEGYELGYRSFVLQSGEDIHYSEQIMTSIVGRLKRRFPDAAITLSVGEQSETFYRALYNAGADRYLLRHETASRTLYESLHPGMSFDNRMDCLHILREIGYQVGAGFMVGLPGQTHRHLAEDLLFLKAFQPEMIGIGPFIPHSATPLNGAAGGTVEDTLVMIAMARLMVPDALMPATTAMGTLDPSGREKALQAGANVVMPILSPLQIRSKYALYEQKICMGDEPEHCRSCLEMRIAVSGYRMEFSRGDHCSYKAQL